MKKQFLILISILLCALFSSNLNAQSDTLNYNAGAAEGAGTVASVTLNNFSTCQEEVYLIGDAGIWDGTVWSSGTFSLTVNGMYIGDFSPQTIDLTSYIPVTSVQVTSNASTWHTTNAHVGIVVTTAASGPTVSDVFECQGNIASPLSATFTGTGETLKWYTSVNGDNYSATVTPNTSTPGVTSYWVTQADASGCESKYSQIDVTVNQPTTGDTTATACESFNWYGTDYTTSGTQTHVFPNGSMNGCDSIVTLHLTINQPTTGDTTAIVCESFNWYGTDYTTSGTPTHVFPNGNAAGCDSTVTLHLTINQPTTGDTTATACESFNWYGTDYTTSGTQTHVFPNGSMNGCDSIVTLHLTINQPTTGDTTAIVCESFNWYGTDYTTSGTPTHVFPNGNAAGCDSTVTLHLTINQPTTGDTTATACESFNWYGTDYTTSGTQTHVFPNGSMNGCDSIVTLHLTINQPTTGDTTAIVCESFNWYGTDYTTSGTPTHVFPNGNAAGCDSTVTLHLTIIQPATSDTTVIACETFNWYGTDYTTSGTPTHVFPNGSTNGCDSIVTLHLTINQPTTSTTTKTACNSFLWNGITRTTSGTYTFTTTNAAGCDSTATLILTIGTLSVTANVVNNDKLEAVSSGTNLTYRWVDCDLDAYIAGATGATFDVPKIGKYAVEVADGICKTMSSCVSMNHATVNENEALHLGVKVYPNPTSGIVTIMMSGADQVNIHLYDGTGKLIKTYTDFHSGESISLDEFSAGIYTLQIQTENGVQMERLVKN